MKHSEVKCGKIPILKDRLRILQGDLTNTQFAEKVGISRQTMGFYLNGDRIPDAEMLLRICTSLGVSCDYLLGLTDETATDPSVRSVCEYTGLTPATVNLLHYEPDTCIRSFYRQLIDDLIYTDDDINLDSVPEYLIKSATAHIMAEQSTSGTRAAVIAAVNTTINSCNFENEYSISASDAEQFFFMRAQEVLISYIRDCLDAMQREAVSFFKNPKADRNKFKWVGDFCHFDEKDYEPWFQE